MTSAYPKQLDELIRDAQLISRELGAIPSQNKLKAALHVRSERARAVLNALRETGFDPADTAGTRRLQVVPDGPADTTADGPGEPVAANVSAQVSEGTEPAPAAPEPLAWLRHGRSWPIALLAAPAFVAIWSGWVGLGGLTGFGLVHPLPGIADGFTLNSAITLPIGVETYAAYALRVWLAIGIGASDRTRRFAKWSAVGALVLGAAGQVAYHLMIAGHVATAPWWITTAVSCLPVVVLGFGAALAHLQHPRRDRTEVGR
jgi:hypothetical protein